LALRTTADISDGIELDLTSKNYRLGSFNLGTTWIEVDDNNTRTTINTEDLYFSGANLQSNTSGGNSGKHLVITLNGNQYKIKLENP